MKLFIDTNIILDLLQYREPWINDTLVLFQLAKEDKVELIMSDLTFVNVVYIAGKNVDKKALKETLVKLKKFVKFDFWQKFDSENTIVRFASSWATPKENVIKLKEILEKFFH